jgi:hypothetical protein
LLPIIKVAAPERTVTLGHSISGLAGSALALALLAFDDELNTSSGESLKIAPVLPQALKTPASPTSAAAPTALRIIRPFLVPGIV